MSKTPWRPHMTPNLTQALDAISEIDWPTYIGLEPGWRDLTKALHALCEECLDLRAELAKVKMELNRERNRE